MDRSTEEETRGDSHSSSSRDQDGGQRRSRSPVRWSSKVRARHSLPVPSVTVQSLSRHSIEFDLGKGPPTWY